MTHSITTKGLYLAAAFAIAMTNFTNCSDKEAAGYIGQSDIAVEDGKMTPEVMLSLDGSPTRSSLRTERQFFTGSATHPYRTTAAAATSSSSMRTEPAADSSQGKAAA